MTRPVRVSLGVLRAYLILMTLMLGYHVLDISGLLHQRFTNRLQHKVDSNVKWDEQVLRIEKPVQASV
jgi:hypothetical protein